MKARCSVPSRVNKRRHFSEYLTTLKRKKPPTCPALPIPILAREKLPSIVVQKSMPSVQETAAQLSRCLSRALNQLVLILEPSDCVCDHTCVLLIVD